MTRATHANRRRAFTLPEVLATLVLVGIIVPVAMRGLTVALQTSAYARQQLEAGQLAQAKLNELLIQRDQTTFESSGDFGADWPDYRWVSHGQLAAFTAYEVTVTVQWTAQGVPRTLSMATMIYPPSSTTTTTSTPGGT